MFFNLTTLCPQKFTSEEASELPEETSDQERFVVMEAWKHSDFLCRNYILSGLEKIIGARYYIKGYEQYYGPLNRTLDYRSPRDKDGHGTHTSSTAGGKNVPNVSAIGGFASGTASDGVDVISISIGTKEPQPFDQDSIAIGALHAMKKNIVVSCSAGNSGPAPSTLSNTAPWIITVGASSVDRTFLSPVVLGNGKKFMGQTVTPYKLKKKMYPLVYAEEVINSNVTKDLAGFSFTGKGQRENSNMIDREWEKSRKGWRADTHLLPATAVDYKSTVQILNYIKSTKAPMAYIVPGKTVLHTKPAPYMASFTSRGPSAVAPDILKPDITAPGLNILAAWSG
ncbi:hypothetical protein CQW23_04632 [Capsicum baccatum]|uniref:Peptidase S8/S53 domain-containing protein n=1 Tax=Capsicum baccatum TaxID=33114 RepID=A0A2G2XF68_CAPBA|nr:hypothetical protein CQW23_04632 [Capsicum baccatum]